MFFAKEYVKRVELENEKDALANFKDSIEDVTLQYFADKPMFQPNDFDFYYYDELVLGTNTCKYPYATLYIEINQRDNYKPAKPTKKPQKDDVVKAPDLYLPLKEIKNGLIDAFVNYFDEHTLMWPDRYSINFSCNEYDEDDQDINVYYFRVIPCLSYTNKNGQKGIMYYNDSMNMIEIEYPKLAIKNFKEKNKKTAGIYKDYVLLLKNVFMKEKNEKDLPSEIFEILLYNTPNILFENYSLDSMFKLMNYLRNYNAKNFKTLDEQQFAFTTKYKTLSLLYANHVIKKLEKYFNKQK